MTNKEVMRRSHPTPYTLRLIPYTPFFYQCPSTLAPSDKSNLPARYASTASLTVPEASFATPMLAAFRALKALGPQNPVIRTSAPLLDMLLAAWIPAPFSALMFSLLSSASKNQGLRIHYQDIGSPAKTRIDLGIQVFSL